MPNNGTFAQPGYFPILPRGISLALCGHTHGGEIYLPILGYLTVHSDLGQNFRKGHLAQNNNHIYITNAVGTLSAKRFLNVPEVLILYLHTQYGKYIVINTRPAYGVKKLHQ